ncbi:MAG: hypothetical protein BMS9Abin05_0677 [Rhodothermia bacterium]|nr:MAG: hypothetical protein BMS9Abin05_0677 [Rhodothermia bacterium]
MIPGRFKSARKSSLSFKRLVLLLYVGALAASHVVRFVSPDNLPRADQQSIRLREVDGDRITRKEIRFSFVDTRKDGDTRPTVVVLHGSPAASSFMMPLHRALERKETMRILTPDLPGFGGSTRSIPDYSIAAHGAYLIQALDSLGIDKAHLLAYSMGGGVALEAYRQAPERIASIAMVSAIGVQELELTGGYHLNHAIHGLQLAGLWFISELVPHFGWMDDALLGVPYARNFYDTDQRPLREILSGYSGPMEIIHGTDDFLVRYEVALEHYRIVPQSTLKTFKGGEHDLVFTKPDSIATLIDQFVYRVENNLAPGRDLASRERTIAALAAFDADSIPPATGFALAVFFILIIGATLVSEDLATIGAGLMVAKGTLTFGAAASAAFSGIVIGDILLYALGRSIGAGIARRAPLKWFLSKDSLERGASWFKDQGMKVVLVCRFVPGSRLPTFVAAGVLKAPFWRFLLFFFLASLVWTPLLVGLSSVLGHKFLVYYELYEGSAIWLLVGLILLIYGLVHVLLPALTHRGRRRNRSRWQRLIHWEFWSPLVFYVPVFFYVLWLAIRHRSLTVFTAANPGIPQGGFVGESKSDILNRLESPEIRIPRYELIEPDDDGPSSVFRFLQNTDQSFPVVLKPDVGERGDGVEIIRSEADARKYFSSQRRRTLVQEYVSGVEYGVFYYRYPDRPEGHIFSITDKRLISVMGNGHDTLEDLILDDKRANCMAPLHLRVHRHNLNTIPSDGERIQLVDVGTHSRGSLFLDGSAYVTDAVRREFDRITSHFEGFYFGRFDIRTDDLEAFKAGRGFTILELNGVTSEATSIYDPANSLGHAYRILFRQWKIAFEIGSMNRKNGHSVASLRELFGLIREHKLH